MKFVKNFLAITRKTPKLALLAAIVIPGGVIGVAAWISVKSAYRILKNKRGKN